MNRYKPRSLCLIGAIAAAHSGACSAIYNADDFRTRTADGPGGSGLHIESVLPNEVYEGVGCIPDSNAEDGCDSSSSRGVPFVLYGEGLEEGARITSIQAPAEKSGVAEALLVQMSEDKTLPLVVAPTGDMAAFTLYIPVLSGPDRLAANGEEIKLELTVEQEGASSATFELVIKGLDELEGDAVLSLGNQPRYASTIKINTNVSFANLDQLSEPVRLLATSSIEIDTQVRVDGAAPGGPTIGGKPGPGGSQGVNFEQQPEIVGDGGTATNDRGGGGGGHAEQGAIGPDGLLSDGGGPGGAITGARTLHDLKQDGGHGGGSGAGDSRGVGGGGGGVLEATSLGRLIVRSGAVLSARGGNGGSVPACSLTGGTGGGGGGSGGAILLRALHSFDLPASEPPAEELLLDVNGGAGGGGCRRGGSGSVGRVRIDIPGVIPRERISSDSSNTDMNDSVLYQGPILALPPEASSAITQTEFITLDLYANPTEDYWLRMNQGTPVKLDISASDMQFPISYPIPTPLQKGRNRLCLQVVPYFEYPSGSNDPTNPMHPVYPPDFPLEAVNCLDIVYIPQQQ